MVAGGCINLFANANAIVFPMSLALMVLFFRWGKDLWVVDPDTAHAKDWVKSLIYIGVHLGLVLVSALVELIEERQISTIFFHLYHIKIGVIC